jgi:hypothetical protein
MPRLPSEPPIQAIETEPAGRQASPIHHDTNRSHTVPTQTVILRPRAFDGIPSALVILMTILVLLGVAVHAAVL